MRNLEIPFNIEYCGNEALIKEFELNEKRVFCIKFSYDDNPLNITVAIKPNGEKFWTSIPQGRQKEAEEIGKLIANYIRGKK